MRFMICVVAALFAGLLVCPWAKAGEGPSQEPWRAADLNRVTFHDAPAQDPVPLVEEGRAVATLCLPANPSAAVEAAVRELRSCVKEATGADLPIMVGGEPGAGPAIVIGDCKGAADLGLIGERMPPEGFAIRTAPGRVFVVGDPKHGGAAWGMYELAERYVGARWYWPGELGRSVPKAKSLRVPPVWLEDHPVFRRREIWPQTSDPWHGQGTDLAPLHAALRAGNSWLHNVAVHQPDWSGIEEYRKDRPEVFQLTSSGQRDYAMLCYGNPKTLQTYLENIDRRLKGDPKAAIGMEGDTITVSPNDAEIACYCPDCRRLWNPAGGHTGSASRIVSTFVANLAPEVRKRWPDKTVLYLAYLNYDDAPPEAVPPAPEGITFPPNVEVQLCGLPGMAMYKEPKVLAAEQANVDRWLKLTGRPIQNWHYDCWPEDRTKAMYQYPHVVRDYYRANRDKTVGTFINGLTDHWPRQHLSLYCWLKVLWNPDFDVDAATDAYCRRMYGPAAPTVRELVRLQTEGWENSRWPAGGKLTAKAVYTISYPPKTIERMKALLAQAREQAKGDPVASARLAYYAAPFDAFFREADQFARGVTNRLVARRVERAPTIDGRLDEPAWKHAGPASLIQAYDTDWSGKKQGPQVKYPTTVQAVWTPAGVTFGFRMTEPAPQRLVKGRTGHDDSMLWWDDNVEIFLDVTGRGEGDFYHFIINAAGTVADAKGKDYAWDAKGIKTAAFVGADFWSLEVFLPFSEFPEALKPAGGSRVIWTGNFGRHRLADSAGPKPRTPGSVREYQRLNTTFAVPADNLADFGSIEFRD